MPNLEISKLTHLLDVTLRGGGGVDDLDLEGARVARLAASRGGAHGRDGGGDTLRSSGDGGRKGEGGGDRVAHGCCWDM